jgi:hypothetical protein
MFGCLKGSEFMGHGNEKIETCSEFEPFEKFRRAKHADRLFYAFEAPEILIPCALWNLGAVNSLILLGTDCINQTYGRRSEVSVHH